MTTIGNCRPERSCLLWVATKDGWEVEVLQAFGKVKSLWEAENSLGKVQDSSRPVKQRNLKTKSSNVHSVVEFFQENAG